MTMTVPELYIGRGSASSAVAMEHAEQRTWDAVLRDLRSLADLPEDWDGLGASAPAAALLASAFEFATELRSQGIEPPLVVTAGPDGTILFTWQNGSVYRNAEITEPYQAEWMEVRSGEPVKHSVHNWRPLVESVWTSPIGRSPVLTAV